MARNQYKSFDDLTLHDEIFAIVEGKAQSVSEEAAVALIEEAVTRDDLVLVASAVELCEKYRNEITLRSLRHIVSRELLDVTLDILLLDELAARLPETNCDDFLPFLKNIRHEKVRVFCAKIILFDEVLCQSSILKSIYDNEQSILARLYLAGSLFRITNNKEYIELLGKNKKSQVLNVARASNIIIKELGYH